MLHWYDHPQTQGKVERFQQMKKWLYAQPRQPATIATLQTLLDRFPDQYTRSARTGPGNTGPPSRVLHQPAQGHPR